MVILGLSCPLCHGGRAEIISICSLLTTDHPTSLLGMNDVKTHVGSQVGTLGSRGLGRLAGRAGSWATFISERRETWAYRRTVSLCRTGWLAGSLWLVDNQIRIGPPSPALAGLSARALWGRRWAPGHCGHRCRMVYIGVLFITVGGNDEQACLLAKNGSEDFQPTASWFDVRSWRRMMRERAFATPE